MKRNHKTLIGITIGDAAGIGPEIICKVFQKKSYKKYCDILIIGDKYLFDKTIKHYNFNIKTEIISQPHDIHQLKKNILGIIQINSKNKITNFSPGKSSKKIGEIALQSVEKAVELAQSHKINGIVTAPLSKEIVALSNKNVTGHKEYIKKKFDSLE